MKQLYFLALRVAQSRRFANCLPLLGLLALPGLAQTITSFARLSEPIGTSVTIAGTGFDAVASQNVVFFGATRAAVTAASTTSLTVRVPLGATYQVPHGHEPDQRPHGLRQPAFRGDLERGRSLRR